MKALKIKFSAYVHACEAERGGGGERQTGSSSVYLWRSVSPREAEEVGRGVTAEADALIHIQPPTTQS